MKAYYNEKPSAFAEVGNGSVLYRCNIKQVENQSQDGEQSGTQWECDEVTIWKPFDKKKVVKSVIAEIWDSTHEQKLVNEYNSVTLGVIEGEEADKVTEAYTEFLEARKTLKAAVEEDCDNEGIE